MLELPPSGSGSALALTSAPKIHTKKGSTDV
jgi:hypothetical protein